MKAVVAGVVALCLPACAGVGKNAGYPVYPNPQTPRPPAELATLVGAVAVIDGVQVWDKGHRFALLPVCHVVTLKTHVGEGGMGGAWMATVPASVLAIPMQAAHVYTIEWSADEMGSAPVGRIRMRTSDRGPDGRVSLLAAFDRCP